MNQTMKPKQVESDIVPISRHTDARELATDAYEQLLGLLGQLDEADWEAQTECPEWTVADMVGHLIGAGRSYATLREFLRQQLYGFRHRKDYGGNQMDAYNALQIADHADLTPEQRTAAIRQVAPKSVAFRMRFAPMMSLINAPVDQTGSTASGMPKRENGGHLVEVVITRDVWLHTIDISRAVGRELDVSAPVNARIIEDVVAEWAGRHGQPFELQLTGAAGGHFTQGAGGERVKMDAVEFARTLSGREPADGLLATRVLF